MILQFLRYWQNHIYANDLHKLSYHSHILKNIVSYFFFLPALPGRGGILLNIKCIYSGNFIGFNSLHFAIRVFVKIHVVDSLSIFYDVVRCDIKKVSTFLIIFNCHFGVPLSFILCTYYTSVSIISQYTKCLKLRKYICLKCILP
nr:MAG TPA: hypothetical protein [Caudoviricetes sp.]